MFFCRSGYCKTKTESNWFKQSLTFVTLVFLAQKAGQGVSRPESKTNLMSSPPLLHWHFTICGFSPFPTILINWLSWESDQLNSILPSKISENAFLTKNAASLVGWFSIENFLQSKLINYWCRVASSAWLGLRLGFLPTWDQTPPLYYQMSK